MLKLNNISKHFILNLGTTKVFKNLNFEANKGEFITIIGSNGAGKSTLLSLISGSILPDKGSIYLDDKDITRI